MAQDRNHYNIGIASGMIFLLVFSGTLFFGMNSISNSGSASGAVVYENREIALDIKTETISEPADLSYTIPVASKIRLLESETIRSNYVLGQDIDRDYAEAYLYTVHTARKCPPLDAIMTTHGFFSETTSDSIESCTTLSASEKTVLQHLQDNLEYKKFWRKI